MIPEGATRLNEVRSFLRQFYYFPSEAQLDACALWIAHTHIRDNDGNYLLDYTGRLAVLSDDYGCGKTLLLDLVIQMSFNGERMVKPTAPGALVSLNEDKSTIGLDEIDRQFRSPNAGSDLVTLLNAGYEKGAWVRSARRRESCFGPAAVAGVGKKFKTMEELRALYQRSIVINVQKKPESVEIVQYRKRFHESRAHTIRRSLHNWVQSVLLELMTIEPVMPEGIVNRDQDIWEPLFAIAELAGGEWPRRALDACRAITLNDVPSNPELGYTEQLFVALGQVFAIGGEDRLPTATIIERIYSLPGGYWAAQWPTKYVAARELAALLADHDITTAKLWIPDDSHERGGYSLQGYYFAPIAQHIPAGYEQMSSSPDDHSDVPIWLD